MNQPLVIGHRGAKALAPENTLKAFQTALDLKVDGVELDVHLSSDDELVVFHDSTLDRMTNGKGNVSDFSLSELKQLRIKKVLEIPTLKEVLELIYRKCFINIELKGQNTAEAVVKLIQEYVNNKNWKYEHFIISSFDWKMLEDVTLLDSKIKIAVLTEYDLDSAIEFAEKIKSEFINPYYKLLNKNNVELIHDLGLKLFPWTVNEPDDIQLLKSFHVNGIITDFPDRI